MSTSDHSNPSAECELASIPYHPTAYVLHQSPFLFSATPDIDQPSELSHDIRVTFEIWRDLACHGDYQRCSFHCRLEMLRGLPYCNSFHDYFKCMERILDYIVADVPQSQENYYSLDKFMNNCGIVPNDSDWSINKRLWEIVHLNEPGKSIRELCMAFLSLRWLHEDDSYFDPYDTSPQEHIYNNCVRVGDIVL